MTAKPKIGSGESMECKHDKGIHASENADLPPYTTWAAISGANLSMGQPRIAMAMRGVPPMA